MIGSISALSDKEISNLSDHVPICVHLLLSHHISDRSPVSQFLLFRKGKYPEMDEFLQDTNFDDFFTSTDKWLLLIYQAISIFLPSRRSSRLRLPKWFNPQLRYSLHKLRNLRKLARVSPSPYRLSAVRTAESNFSNMVLVSKLKYEEDLVNIFSSLNNPAIYSYIHSISKDSVVPPYISYKSESAI